MNQDQSKTDGAAPVSSTPLLADMVARCMCYAYWRGRLDGDHMPDCQEKEQTIQCMATLEARHWKAAAEAMLSANYLLTWKTFLLSR